MVENAKKQVVYNNNLSDMPVIILITNDEQVKRVKN